MTESTSHAADAHMISVVCPLCGADQSKAIFKDRGYDKIEYQIVRCAKCAMSYVNPQPTDEHLARLYSGYYGNEAGVTEHALDFRHGVFEQVLDLLAARHPTGERRLLDVGCGNGELLTHARNQGWLVSGVEISTTAVKHAKEKRGLDVVEGNLETLPFHEATFDAVTILDVLEHLRNPRRTLTSVYKTLKPGGTLVVRVPNTPVQILKAHFMRLRQGREVTTMATPLHLNHFEGRTLQRLVGECGFKVKRLQPGAADGVGLKLIVKQGLVLGSRLTSFGRFQTGNILLLIVQK